MHCTENSEINDKMSGVDVIDLCSENQTKNNEFHKGKESTKQESRDKKKSKTITRMGSKNRPRKVKPMAESEENETVMTCWENLKENQMMRERNLSKTCKNSKDKEEQVDSTLYTGN